MSVATTRSNARGHQDITLVFWPLLHYYYFLWTENVHIWTRRWNAKLSANAHNHG